MRRISGKNTFVAATILGIGMFLTLSGCTVIEYSEFSSPHIDPYFSYEGANGVLFQLQNIDIAVTSQNRWVTEEISAPLLLPPFIPIPNSPHYKAPLLIELRFDSATTVNFKPMDVRIESGGTSMAPNAFSDPGHKTFQPNLSPSFRQRYFCRPDSNEIRTDDKPVSIEGKVCIWLKFDRSASPDEPFVFRLNGLTREDRPIVIPEIHFQKGGAWFGGTIP